MIYIEHTLEHMATKNQSKINYHLMLSVSVNYLKTVEKKIQYSIFNLYIFTYSSCITAICIAVHGKYHISHVLLFFFFREMDLQMEQWPSG